MEVNIKIDDLSLLKYLKNEKNYINEYQRLNKKEIIKNYTRLSELVIILSFLESKIEVK